MTLYRNLTSTCETCLKSKPNSAPDRGLVASLPIPQLANDILYVDFVQMDPFNNLDYVLTIVDALTRFVKFLPCTKTISGESTMKLILQEWIQHYGKPMEIMSDNDIRFSQEKGFYQKAFSALGVKVNFCVPRHPQSNGLCERINRSFIQNMRVLSMELKTNNWPKLIPLVNFIMNSQITMTTGFSPHELFLGRPSWKFETQPEPGCGPLVTT